MSDLAARAADEASSSGRRSRRAGRAARSRTTSSRRSGRRCSRCRARARLRPARLADPVRGHRHGPRLRRRRRLGVVAQPSRRPRRCPVLPRRSRSAQGSSSASIKSSPATTPSDGREASGRLPRWAPVRRHTLRPAARARVPLGRLGGRGRAARRARRVEAGRPRQPSLHRRVQPRLRRARRGRRGDRERRREDDPDPDRRVRADRDRARVRRPPALARTGGRPGPAAAGAAARLCRPARRCLRGLRGTLHRHRARLDPRARELERGHHPRGRAAACLLARPRGGVRRLGVSRSRARWAPSAGSAPTTRPSRSPPAPR